MFPVILCNIGRMKFRLFICFLSLLLTVGCINPLGNSQKETVAAKVSESIANQQSLSVERSTKSAPPPSLEISVPVNQSQNTVNSGKTVLGRSTNFQSSANLSSDGMIHIKIPSQSESNIKAVSNGEISSSGTSNSTYNFVKDISLGGKIILIAVGLGLLLLVTNMIRKRYKSVDFLANKLDKAATIAEEKIANRINSLKEKALSSSDPVENSKIAAELSHWNEARGKVKAEIEALKE